MGDLEGLQLEEVAYFDSYPPHDDPGTNFGPWSVYPFFESGTVVLSDILLGLIVLEVIPAPEPSAALLRLSAGVAIAAIVRARRGRRPLPGGRLPGPLG